MSAHTHVAVLHTNLGDITVNLLANHAPKTVANFVGLATGQIEWEMAYKFGPDPGAVVFEKVVQLRPFSSEEPGHQYIVHATKGDKHYILSVRSQDGNIFWLNLLDHPSPIVALSLAAASDAYFFYVVISDPSNQPLIGKFDGDGHIVIGQKIPIGKPDTIIKAITPKANGIIIAGNFTDVQSIGFVLDFHDNLKIVKALAVPDTIVHDVKYDGANYVVSAYNIGSQSVYITLFGQAGSFRGYLFPNTTKNESKIQLKHDGYYVLHYTPAHGILNLLNTGIEVQWGPVAVQTPQAFNSCKTKVLARPHLVEIPITVKVVNLQTSTGSINAVAGQGSVAHVSSDVIEICPPIFTTNIPIDETTSLQSPNFYLQSAGSEGDDSTKGMHLRWVFLGVLGDKHLPKRDYAGNTANFNKPDDVVRVYRSQYRKFKFEVDLLQPPSVVDDSNRLWVYAFGGRNIYVHFRNTNKYDQVRAAVNPMTDTASFYQNYAHNLIEIENKSDLFFAVRLIANANPNPNGHVRAETMGVNQNTLVATKYLSARKKFVSSVFSNMRLVSENGRSVRYQVYLCRIIKVEFEFYADFIGGLEFGYLRL